MDFNQKLYHASIKACLFFVVSLPYVYTKTNKWASVESDCPTYKTKLLHALVFFALSMMSIKFFGKDNMSTNMMIKYSIWASLLFFFMSSPELYKLTRNLSDSWANEDGCPTLTGVVAHSVAYGLVLMGMMSLNH